MAKNKKKITMPSQVIKDRRERLYLKDGYLHLLFRILLIALVAYIVLSQGFIITQVSGNEMFPAFKDGDLIIGFRLQQDYQKDDVVVYEQDGKYRVGRIIASELDVVDMKPESEESDSGILRVNGTQQSGEIVFSTYAKEGIEYPYRVPEGCVFILGDYRTIAVDSRDYGAISMKDVKGKVITLLRRRTL